MQVLYTVLSLTLPAISALLITRRLPRWSERALNILVALVVYVLLHLLPIHILGTLQLFHVISSVSLFDIALMEAFVLLIIAGWFHFDKSAAISSYGDPSVFPQLQTMPTYVLVCSTILILSYSLFALDVLTAYPRGWDGVYYHLPLAVRWLQDGSFMIPASKTWRYSMPANGEVSMMVMLGLGWQALAPGFNLIALVIICCACYLISLKCGASRIAAMISVLALLSVPIITFQTFSAYIDLYGSAFLIGALALFFYRYDISEQVNGKNSLVIGIALFGLSLGISVGTKPIFYVYGALLFLAALVTLVIERNRHGKSLALLIGVLIVSTLLPSLFWFSRAFFTTGNPFYPLKVELFGHVIFDGYYREHMTGGSVDLKFVRTIAEWLIYPWTEYKRGGYNYSTGSGLGAMFASFVPVGLFYSVYTGRDRKRCGSYTQSILCLFFVVGLVIWWFAFLRLPRFGIPVVVIACILSASLFEVLHRSRTRLFRIVLISSLVTTCAISSFVPLRALLGRAWHGRWTRSSFYGSPSLIDDLPQGSTILNLSNTYINHFALAGERLGNRVIPSFEVPVHLSKDFLLRERVEYIICGDLLEGECADLHDIEMVRIYKDLRDRGVTDKKTWTIWRLIQPRGKFSHIEGDSNR